MCIIVEPSICIEDAKCAEEILQKSRHPVLLRRNRHRQVTAGSRGKCEIRERRDRLSHEHVPTVENSKALNTEKARHASPSKVKLTCSPQSTQTRQARRKCQVRRKYQISSKVSTDRAYDLLDVTRNDGDESRSSGFTPIFRTMFSGGSGNPHRLCSAASVLSGRDVTQNTRQDVGPELTRCDHSAVNHLKLRSLVEEIEPVASTCMRQCVVWKCVVFHLRSNRRSCQHLLP